MKTLSTAIIFSLLLLSACTGSLLNAIQGNGDIQLVEREIADFSRIEFSGQGDLRIEIGTESSLSISADSNLLSYLITEVEGGTLRLYTENNARLAPEQAIVYTINATSLEAVSFSGSGNITIGAVETATFSVSMSGSGQIVLADLQTESLRLDLSGAGSVTITGNADEQFLDLSGTGSYEGVNFATLHSQVNLSGIGNVNLRVSERLEGSISGIGNLSYYGNPTVDVDRSGLGNISRIGD